MSDDLHISHHRALVENIFTANKAGISIYCSPAPAQSMHGLIPKLKATMTKRIMVVVRMFHDLEAEKVHGRFDLACGLVYRIRLAN